MTINLETWKYFSDVQNWVKEMRDVPQKSKSMYSNDTNVSFIQQYTVALAF